MINEKSVLAVIPARAGSKGLPGKNIKKLLGKPLILWSVEAAKQCKYIDDIYVSTDSNEIADIVKQSGISVPSLRPNNLATDNSSSIDVVIFSIDDAQKKFNKVYDLVVLLEPTSPLRDYSDISSALEELVATNNAKAITGLGIIEDHHPEFIVSLSKDGFHKPYVERKETSGHLRRQDISKLYFHEGSIYISYIDYFKKVKSFYTEKTIGYIVPKWKSLEVDDIYDFIMIEAIMKKKQEGLI